MDGWWLVNPKQLTWANAAYVPAMALVFFAVPYLAPWVPGAQGRFGWVWGVAAVAVAFAGQVWLSSRISPVATKVASATPVLMFAIIIGVGVLRHFTGQHLVYNLISGPPFLLAMLMCPVIVNHRELQDQRRAAVPANA